MALNYPSTEKTFIDHDEDIEVGAEHHPHAGHGHMNKHGDRGLSIVGDERIPLTEADVRYPSIS